MTDSDGQPPRQFGLRYLFVITTWISVGAALAFNPLLIPPARGVGLGICSYWIAKVVFVISTRLPPVGREIVFLAGLPFFIFSMFPWNDCPFCEALLKEAFLKEHAATSEQLAAIDELDAFLDDLSGPHNEIFWCDPEPLEDDSRWERIRELSRRVLRTMNWEYSLPEKDGATYVFQDHSEENENGEDKSGEDD